MPLDVAFVTAGDGRHIPMAESDRERFDPTTTYTRLYTRYAAAIVGPDNVLVARNRLVAGDVLRAWRQGRPLRHLYLIGHGDIAFAFAVGVRGRGENATVQAEDRAMLTYPTVGEGGLVGQSSAFFREVGAGMALLPGLHRFDVRACYLGSRYLEGYAAALAHGAGPRLAEVTGYRDYYALIERSNGAFRSEVQEERRDVRGQWRTVSRSHGTQAPPPQLAFCVRAGRVVRGRCSG